ncbi:MAG: helix-turn-helix transcriptional regulator [Clostridia bacterium]|nr:helix-turn-helix transcriptional regulator [Clostridia bacterium]
MDDLKKIVAGNLTELRRLNGITQAELAERLNYTDKAVSKWERGDSLPDVTVLKAIADMFNVTVDYLLREKHDAEERPDPADLLAKKIQTRNRAVITGLALLLVWLIATCVFVFPSLTGIDKSRVMIAFIYAVPVSMIVWLIFNSIWFNQRRNYLIISFLMWTVLGSVYLTDVVFRLNIPNSWLIFVLGVPGQIIIAVWSAISTKSNK